MITKREKNLSVIMIIVQVILTVLVFYITQYIYPERVFKPSEDIFFLIQIPVIWGFFLYKLNLGIIFRVNFFKTGIRDYLALIFFGMLIFYLEIKFNFILKNTGNSFKFIFLFGLIDFLLLISFKLFFYYVMRFIRRKGHNIKQIIIIADSKAIPFVNYFIDAKDWGYKIHAILTHDTSFSCKYNNIRVIKNEDNLKNFITKHPVDEIIYCLSIDDKTYDLEQLIIDSEEIGITLHIMQEEYLQNMICKNKIKGLDNSFVTHSKTDHSYICLKMKDVIDLLFSVVALILLLPVFIIIAILIKLSDGGPILFKQERVGLNGRRFYCHKFRSMVVNAEQLIVHLEDQNESDGPTFKIENDPRITKIGRILRKTSLDELPQFYNVFKGDMSIVGPRPPLMKEVKQYEREQLRRLSMKPGITCIWQTKGRNQVTFIEWMRMDLEYIDKWSLWMDFKIMVDTVGVVFKAKGR
jgi:exopolysaccharide biosynthesis polyprenyl glycosylphosphotransferase